LASRRIFLCLHAHTWQTVQSTFSFRPLRIQS